MKKELIKDGDFILAIVLRGTDYPPGLKFYNSYEDFLQVGTWNYSKGQKIDSHMHIITQKKINRTQELIYVKNGQVKNNIYNEEKTLIDSIILKKGDMVIQLAGGHDFEVLKNNTQVLMVKNGPYLGQENDKIKYNN